MGTSHFSDGNVKWYSSFGNEHTHTHTHIHTHTHTHTHTLEHLSAITKNEILPFTMTWMELESIMLSEISQSEKDKHHVISLICGIQETKQMNIARKKKRGRQTRKQTLNYREQTDGYQRGDGWGDG